MLSRSIACERVGDVDAVRHVRCNEFDEELLGVLERVLAAPQRVVRVEPHDLEGVSACHRRSAVDGVEVVVDGDPAHAHRIGDVLDRPAQDERASFVEEPDGELLVLA